jgi:hypothetical protein
MKTDVYSWRLERTTKEALEQEARREGISLARLLDRITREWIETRRAAGGDDKAQRLLHLAVRQTIGSIDGGDPRRSRKAREAIRSRLRKAHDR